MRRIYALLAIGLLLIIPFISRSMIGIPPGFFSFPMKVHYIQHAPFSLFASLIFVTLYFIYIFFIFFLALNAQSKVEDHRQYSPASASTNGWYFENPRAIQPKKSYFPYWGYIGIILNLSAWYIAWAKPLSMGVISQYTFSPLWLGFALALDGLVFYRKGVSIFAASKTQFFLICLLSSLTWWFFEYCNMYVQNWWYQLNESLTGIQKFFAGTAAFITVTPAILEMTALLTTFPFIPDHFSNGSVILGKGRGWVKSLLAIVIGSVSWFLVPLYPNELFFLIWISTLLICEGALGLAGIATPVSEMGKGRFGQFIVLNGSALLCGFLWEMWNYYSYPKWYYTVPYIQGPQLFEMPLVGFLGYLTFGPLTFSLLQILWLLIFNKKFLGKAPSTD